MGEYRDAYRELFERSADAILIIEDGRFVDCNQATVEMLHAPAKGDLLRTHPSELSPPTQPDGRQSYEKANEMMALAFERGSHRFEWDHRRFDGEVFPVEVLLTAVLRDGKRILHVVWRDITERKRLEEQLRNAQKMEIVGRLAGGIAHDFNNLLVAIIGNAELLQQRVRDPVGLQFAHEIQEAGERGASLVRQLLLFGRPQSLQAAVIDAVPVLVELERLLRRLISEDVELELRTAPGPLPVFSSRAQLEQVVINLVTNARDAMPNGGVLSIALRSMAVDAGAVGVRPSIEPGTYAMLTVTDTGTGMTDEVIARATEPFFTTKPVGKGTGLGLPTVDGIARQAGGRLCIDSVAGRGTAVSVYFPLREGSPDSATRLERTPVARPGAGASVLIVEDDDGVAAVVARTLAQAGYQVERVGDGQAALNAFDVRPFALVVSDVVMPRMGGPELVRALRERGNLVPVVLMSGYTNEALAVSELKCGPILEKPFPPHQLLSRVAEALGGHDARAVREPTP